MPAPSFDSPRAALGALRPDLLTHIETAETAVKLLARAIGLEGENDHLSLQPFPDGTEPALHQAAGSAIYNLLTTRDPALAPGQTLTQIAAANPWFSPDRFARYTNRLRQDARKLRTKLSSHP